MKREITKRGREKKFKGEKPVIHKTIFHDPLTGAQVVPRQWLMTPGQIPQADLLDMMFCDMEHPFGQLGSVVLPHSAPASCEPTHWQNMGTWKVLGRVSTTWQQLKYQCVVLSTLFSYWFRSTALYQRGGRKLSWEFTAVRELAAVSHMNLVQHFKESRL